MSRSLCLRDSDSPKVFYWTTVPKNRNSYHPSRGIREEEITKILRDVAMGDDLDEAEERLLAIDGIRRFLNGVKTDKEKDDFRRHLRRYLQIYLPDCPWEVNSTNRYTIVSHEAAVTARRSIRRNESIKYLSGISVTINAEEEKEISSHKKDFSIVVSSRSKCTSLFMGPARFANHDCDANAKLVTTGHAGIEIIATRPIEAGDEITVTYGENYFGEDNCECLCQSCEDELRNGWAPEDGAVVVKPSFEQLKKEEGYSLRRRRRDDSLAGSSRTPSVTPDIRPRVSKASSKSSRFSRAQEASALASPPRDKPPRGRKRSVDALATPPKTPAKRLKVAELLNSERSSSRGSTVSRSDSFGSGDAAETDMTSPEKETPPPAMHALAKRPAISMKREDSNGGTLAHVPLSPRSMQGPTPSPQKSSDFGSRSISSSSSLSSMSIAAILNAPTPSEIDAEEASERVRDSKTLPESSPAEAQRSPSVPVSLETEAPHVAPETISPAMAGIESTEAQQQPADTRASTAIAISIEPVETSQAAEPEEKAPKKPRQKRRVFVKEATPPARRRTAGDYILTRLLLSEPEMAWIQCMNCNTYFVQKDAYFTKSNCPRCERHSKLYGFVWPKTARVGPHDKEERVLDHRSVHRFLNTEDERRVRSRTALTEQNTAAKVPDEPERGRRSRRGAAAAAAEVVEVAEEAAADVRRSGRSRRVSSRLAGR